MSENQNFYNGNIKKRLAAEMDGHTLMRGSASLRIGRLRRYALPLLAGATLATLATLLACQDATNPDVAAVELQPESAAILQGDTIRITAAVTDRNGNPAHIASLTWLSSDTAVAVVDATGLVTGIAEGMAAISVEAGGARGAADIEVWKPIAVKSSAVDTTPSPLVRTFTVKTDRPAAIEIDYWTAGSARLRVVSAPPRLEHSLLVSRLIPSSGYQFEVRTVGPGDLRGEPKLGTFQTASLPASLAEYRFDARGRRSSPLTMLELRSDTSPAISPAFVAVDEDGQVVWFWLTQGRPGGFSRRQNGNFILFDRGRGLLEVSPDGRVIAELPLGAAGSRMHHDAVVTPQNTVIFITRGSDQVVNDTLWAGDRIYEWDPEQTSIELRWEMFDFYSAVDDRGRLSRPGNFAHSNSLFIGPRGNIVASLKNLDQVISIAPDYQSLEWKLGGARSDFELAASDIFSGQHTASEVAPGRILLFDNGTARTGNDRYSRALELELDVATGVARKVWEFKPLPEIYSRNVSSARRLENGNTLVLFGADTAVPKKVYEVSPDGLVVWLLQMANATSVYRASSLRDIAGEFVVLDP